MTSLRSSGSDISADRRRLRGLPVTATALDTLGRWPSSRPPTPTRRPATSRRRSRSSRASIEAGEPLPDAARRDRHRQDGDDGLDHREGRQAGARDRAQQDARRAALQRVPRVLPGQRGRVLRLLLRLLPARGVRPAGRPLHREGLVPERRHRAPAARRDLRAPHAPRRRRRRLGLVHLRPRLAGGVARARARSSRWGRRTTATRRCAS